MEDSEREPLSAEVALQMLDVQDDLVHTLKQAGWALVGCRWTLAAVREQFERHGAEVAGSMAVSMGHGVASQSTTGSWVFFATKRHS